MIKRKIFIPVLIVLILFIACISTFVYVNNEKEQLYAIALKHLTETKGYKEQDIKSIEVVHSFLNVLLTYNEWSIDVVFNDDPNAIYYTYKNKVFRQGGVSGPHGNNHDE